MWDRRLKMWTPHLYLTYSVLVLHQTANVSCVNSTCLHFQTVSLTTCLVCGVMFTICFEGNYFASHFFMGGEKFDTPHPEGYLFGENMDLNFLGNRPVQVTLDKVFWIMLAYCVQYISCSGVMMWRDLNHCLLDLQFPYVTPAPHEPVKTLRSLVNIRKDSLRLVRWDEVFDYWLSVLSFIFCIHTPHALYRDICCDEEVSCT